MAYSNGYIVGFAAGVCAFCSIFVAGSAVALKEKQETNKVLDRYEKVLSVSGLMEPGASLSPSEVTERFESNVQVRILDLQTGQYADEAVDAQNYDQQRAKKDPAMSVAAPPNDAKVLRMPKYASVYQIMDGEKVDKIVLPIEGKGLWSTLLGFLAVDASGQTVRGITYYQHGETPGLGGEVDNPKWKKLWDGRKIYDESGEVQLRVIKGAAGPPEKDPFKVDGLSGASLTGRGVTNMIAFWLGPNGFGPYLKSLQSGGEAQ